MSVGNRPVQYLVTAAVCLAGVTSGVALSWTTPVLPKFRDNETELHITSDQISWVAALGSPGFMTGSLLSRFVSDSYGRRSSILGSAFPMIAATLFLMLFANIWLLYLARVLWGIAIGMVTTVSTIYLAEISDKEIRGTLSISSRFMFNLGNFLAMAVGPLVSYSTLNYLMLPLPVLYFAACWFIPETPYYSLKAGKVDQARKALTQLRKYNDEKELEDELMTMSQDVKRQTQRSGSLKELLTGRQYRKAFIICAGIKMCQMLTGSLLIQHYFGIIIKDSKVKLDLGTACIIFGAVRFVSSLMSSYLADRLGRRPLLIYSFLGTAISLSLAAGYYYCLEISRIDEATIAPYGIIAFVGIIFSVILSSLGFNSLIYLIPAELFPMNVKAVAMTTLNIFGGSANFAIVKGFMLVMSTIGLFGVFTVFTCISFVGSVFSYCVVPETKGKSLREILAMLQGEEYDEAAAEKLNKPIREEDGNGLGDAIELKTHAKEV